MWIRSSDGYSAIRPREALADRLLRTALGRLVRRGSLTVTAAGGARFRLGDGAAPSVAIRFADAAAEWALLIDPDLHLGELFADGRLIIERGSIYDFLRLALQDSAGNHSTSLAARALVRLRALTRPLGLGNPPERSKRNVAQHYDLDERLYRLFLDRDLQYSCAYFDAPGLSLEEAQLAKKRHVTAKLLLEPGQRVLDIGSGWGGLALYLAGVAGVESVTGITLSEEQLARSRRRARDEGLESRVAFDLADYRQIDGPFDRIVSIGMFEHVGLGSYPAFFRRCRDLLAPDGVMVLHTIGRSGVPWPTNPWIQRYIFPGGYLPTLSEITPAVERFGLIVTDVEVLRLHYAETVRTWRERFLARRDEAKALYDERFCRMWEFYLAASEATFRFEDTVVFQIQLARRNDVVPLTRDYIGQAETALRRAEALRLRRPVAANAAE